MIEETVSSKPAKWKRPVIGGLLSAIPAFILFLMLMSPGLAGSAAMILYIGFAGPITLFWSTVSDVSLLFFFNVIIWFVIGAVIAGLIKKNLIAVLCWLAVVVLFFFLGVSLGLMTQ